jgi:hypothetical protein
MPDIENSGPVVGDRGELSADLDQVVGELLKAMELQIAQS